MQFKCLFAAVLAAAISFGGTAFAANISPSFDGAPTGTGPDRFDPASLVDINSFQGRNNVLEIGISAAQGSANRPIGQQGDFYNTQGRSFAMTGGIGSSFEVGVYIDSSWANPANGNKRTDAWGVLNDPTAGSDPNRYLIVGVTNQGGPLRYRVWDDAIGWVNLAIPVALDAWTDFEVTWTGGSFVYELGGNVVYVDNTVGGTAAGTGFNRLIMQAYNFFDPLFDNNTPTGFVPTEYANHWSSSIDNAAAVSAPPVMALFGLGLAGIAFTRRRFAA